MARIDFTFQPTQYRRSLSQRYFETEPSAALSFRPNSQLVPAGQRSLLSIPVSRTRNEEHEVNLQVAACSATRLVVRWFETVQ